MWLYLVHHADAVPADVDSTRPLSARGRSQAADVARRVAARKARPKAIWHSGKLRARETAEIYLTAVNPFSHLHRARAACSQTMTPSGCAICSRARPTTS